MSDARFSVASLLRPVNAALAPLIRLGWGNPLPLTYGFTVLEIPGRKSGRVYDIPVVCFSLGDRLAVATVRNQSQWFRNLDATDELHAWWGGRRYRCRGDVACSEGVLKLALVKPAGD